MRFRVAPHEVQEMLFMEVDGQLLNNCRVCGQAPEVERLPDNGLRIGCVSAEPEPHRVQVESEPQQYAIDTWNLLQGRPK